MRADLWAAWSGDSERQPARIFPFRPAGGAWSSANDLVKYVRFELNEGKTDGGQQWVSAKNLLQRRVPLDEVAAAVLAGDLHNSTLVIATMTARASREGGWTSLRPADSPWPEHPGRREGPTG